MARVKRRQIRKTRLRKLFRRSKGFFNSRRNTLRQAHEAVMKAQSYKFRGRKEKKRQFRRMWIVRINAARRPLGMNYSRFIHGLKLANVGIDRKQLSELAIHDPSTFGAIVDRSRAAQG
jgi:large subunit ribosomal protein L20